MSRSIMLSGQSILQTDGSFKRAINTVNPLGTKGDLAKAFATLVSMLWAESYTFLSPVTFRVRRQYNPGYNSS
jgi:ubiquitin C-terminal hydrolase